MKRLFELFCTVLLSAVLIGCSKPDRNLPYEYMRIRTLSPSESGLKYVDISSLGLSLVKWERNYFVVGSSECQELVSRESDTDLKLKLRAWNVVVSEMNDFLYLPAAAVELQCIAILGTDNNCVEKANEAAKPIKSMTAKFHYLSSAMNACSIRSEVGQGRRVSLDK